MRGMFCAIAGVRLHALIDARLPLWLGACIRGTRKGSAFFLRFARKKVGFDFVMANDLGKKS